MAFALPVKLSLSQPMSFFFCFLDALPHPACVTVSKSLCGAQLSVGVKPQHVTYINEISS